MKTKISLSLFVLALSLFFATPTFAAYKPNLTYCGMYKNRLKLYKSLLQEALHTNNDKRSFNNILVKVYKENIKITKQDIKANCK